MNYQQVPEEIKAKISGIKQDLFDKLDQLPDFIRSVSTSSIPKPKSVKEKNKRTRRKANKAASKVRRK